MSEHSTDAQIRCLVHDEPLEDENGYHGNCCCRVAI